ncbi:type IV pilin protein [Agarilytica rhodophyticola]|uniref:type IV pilin protein n=1 Tax=Agarilytica rhodophyticola TaxID=1737490 RepID=UPI000B34179A|nr:type IV pilin protein [Agarilytica rhodophyticola]
MFKKLKQRKLTQQGFNLVELLIVIAIISIIAAIGYPSYQDSLEKSRRTDGREALLRAAALQERWYLQRNQYTNNMLDIGGADSEERYYTLATAFNFNGANDCSAADERRCFTLTATAQGVQANDEECIRLTIDNLGRKRSFRAGAGTAGETTNTGRCWN